MPPNRIFSRKTYFVNFPNFVIERNFVMAKAGGGLRRGFQSADNCGIACRGTGQLRQE